MTDWGLFWIGAGFAIGCYSLAMGMEALGEQAVVAIREWWEQRYRYHGRTD